jgi:general secretion pathway protein F
MKSFPDSFSKLYCATVDAGEKSGHLVLVLKRLADYIEQQHRLRQKIQSALIYPTIMTVVSMGILIFLLTFVVPKMMDVFDSIGQTLPGMTLMLLAISGAIKHYWYYGLILMGSVIFGFKAWIRRSAYALHRWHKILLVLPMVGQNIQLINTARFSRTFSVLSESGVSVLEAMQIASSLVTNVIIQKAITEATQKVKEGANISLALKQTEFFPVMSIYLIASGEKSGELESMLGAVADNQDEQIERFIDVSLKLFEPMMILVMGALVLFIVLAVMLPVFSINQLVS